MHSNIEKVRLRISKQTDSTKKSQFGQFLTPERIAAFMAGLFRRIDGDCRLLDAGAGIGSLSASFLDRWNSGGFRFGRVELDAFEIDTSLHSALTQTLFRYKSDSFRVNLDGDDFIHVASDAISSELLSKELRQYTHAIINPPYKKIASGSGHRLALRRVGIETVNLYSAFVALTVELLEPHGEAVAIIPRSFCNGPYFRPFRDFVLKRAAIRHMHLFESRNKAFKDDKVLQENLIILLERSARQGPVRVSTSTDDTFADLTTHEHPFDRIVFPEDANQFIHVPTSSEPNALELSPTIRYTLGDLGIKVSTGPVVDFRMREHLRDMPGRGAVPLLYPGHFIGQNATWPIDGMKKPNAIERNAETEKWLFPNGFYCVVRRFSPKEEKRRIVASVVDPSAFDDAPMLGFENHLNLFHENKHGMPEMLAHGLATYLNMTPVDEHFRRFNGHTQVNAADLKVMKYPSRERLIELGAWSMKLGAITQQHLDAKFETLRK